MSNKNKTFLKAIWQSSDWHWRLIYGIEIRFALFNFDWIFTDQIIYKNQNCLFTIKINKNEYLNVCQCVSLLILY